MFEQKDFVNELGAMALAVKLRRISDLMVRSGHRLYKNLKVDFEPNWFLIFLLLKENNYLSITEIADALGFTHPSINTMVNKILRKGYVEEARDPDDKRKRLIRLSEKGREVLLKLEPVWDAGKIAMDRLVNEENKNIMEDLQNLERKLQKKGFCERVVEEITQKK